MKDINSELISVVMSAYNHAHYVGAAIESVLAQSHKNIEFLIADDGSSDGTVEEIKKFCDPRITFLSFDANRGACAATNELIAMARGQYICIMNSDDIWCSVDKLRYQIGILQERPEVGATFGRAQYIDGSGSSLNNSAVLNGDIFDQVKCFMPRQSWLEHFFMHGNCLCHPTIMIRKECYDRLGLYRNTMRQLPDLDMWIRLAKHYEIHVSSEVLVSFRILPGENASSPTTQNSIRHINEFHLIKRNFFKGMSDKDFKLGFGKHFVQPNASDRITLNIEKALLYFHKKSISPELDGIIGIELISSLLEDPQAKDILRLQYGIDDKWLHDRTGGIDISKMVSLADRDVQIATLNQAVANRDGQIAALQAVIESAKAWQKRSWAKRAFHKWRAPGEERKKINFLKRIERSVRKRRDQLLNRSSRTPNKEKDSGPEKSGLTFIRSLAFHHSGKPRGWVRFLLFHKNKKPRRFFIRVSCKKSGRPRKLFSSWMNVASSSSIRNGRTYDEWIKQFDELTISDRRAMASNIVNMKEPPIISVVMPTHNTKFEWLREAIDSVRNQIYPHWQLCIADDASTAPHVRDMLEHYRALDARIQISYRTQCGHISAASNSALALATGDFVALLDHDDVLPEHALYHVAARLQQDPEAQILYSDEDKLAEDGSRTEPHFKSDWNPDLFFSQNYICHLCVIRRSLLEKIGGFRLGVEGSQDHDLLLRCLPHVHGAQIVHIPIILYHWRMHPQSTAQSDAGKSYTTDAGSRSLVDYFNGNGPQGVRVEQGLLPNTYRVRWPIPGLEPLVSLLIPTRDRRELVETAISSIIEKSDYQNFEILILDNGSSNADTLDYFNYIQKRDSRVRVLAYDHPFNYSAINNFGVKEAKGEILGFINNDIEVICPGWLSEMVSHALRPEIGCVGAKLYYSNESIQHCGVILAIGGVAGHSHKNFPKNHPGYFARAMLTQNLSAVTAACLIMRKNVFEEVGGFDEKNLSVAFNDVDLCLKVREAGYRNLWTPYAELYHHESLSRGHEDSPEKQQRFQSEVLHMQEKWGSKLMRDPYYNDNLTLDDEEFSLR
jgi:glycosyltransferase involved in cell wall biosynthesis